METSRLKREVNDLRARGGSADRMVGSSSAISNLRRIIEKIGPANSRVLISGAAGSGKELAARLIHEHSARANGPFVVINAPTMSPEKMEAELFGVESGVEGQARVGALEEAHGGTLYLDEIADMPRETQAKILRVLVDQNFQRVGGASRVSVDVRIISSTSRDLAEAITRDVFAKTFFIGCRWCLFAFLRWPSGGRTFLNSFNTFPRAPRPVWGFRLAGLGRTPWRCLSPMTGRETSASSETMSND